MAKKGGSRHLKRLAAPITYKIPRKLGKWTIRINPGPHPADRAIPLGILIRDILGIASNLREVKYVLRKGYIKVDGKKILDYHFPIGLMDVIELVPENKFYRVLPHKINLIYPYEISDVDDALIKPLQIKNKTMVKGSRIQLTTHDGRNFLFDKDSEYYTLKPGDTIIYNYNENKLDRYIRLEPGNMALITGGSKIGRLGKIKDILKPHPLKPRIVRLVGDSEEYETVFEYVFPIGSDRPIIKIPWY